VLSSSAGACPEGSVGMSVSTSTAYGTQATISVSANPSSATMGVYVGTSSSLLYTVGTLFGSGSLTDYGLTPQTTYYYEIAASPVLSSSACDSAGYAFGSFFTQTIFDFSTASSTLIQSYNYGGPTIPSLNAMNIYPSSGIVESDIGCNTAVIDWCYGSLAQGFQSPSETAPWSGTYQITLPWYLWDDTGLDASIDLLFPGADEANGTIEVVGNLYDVTTGSWLLSTPNTLDAFSGYASDGFGSGNTAQSGYDASLVWFSSLTAGNSYQFYTYLLVYTTTGVFDLFGNAWSDLNVGSGGDYAQLDDFQWEYL
jgi:hypothetical protein